jgi:hypothetical protein
VNGVPLNTENLYSYFAKTQEDKLLSVKQSYFKGRERVYSCSSSEVNLRQQDWVETNRRKVDKL